jgi:hypothetical protein
MVKRSMKIILPLVIILSFFSFLSCEKYPDPFVPKDSFYFNSFESASDTAGWYGLSSNYIVEDAPASGGKYSVEISGGCVIPHAYYRFSPLSADCKLVLRCWGKNLSNGGSVNLYVENQSGGIHISISESAWTLYESEDTLHCVSGSTIILELNSGGIVTSSMRIDQLEISEVQ